MNDYYTVIIFLNIFAMCIMQLCVSRSNTLTLKRKNLFRWLYTIIIIAAFCEWLGNYLQGSGESTRILHIVVKAIELSVSPAIAFLFTGIFEKKHEKAILLFLIAHAVLECLSGAFGFIYSVDAQSIYMHGTFYWIYVLAYILSIVYCVIIVMRNINKYQYSGAGFFIMIMVFMLTGVIIQMHDSNLKVDYVTLGIAATMTYIFTLEMIQQTDELTELLNRRGYENVISHIDQSCVAIFFDVDRFKEINDTYGHAFGDEILKKIGRAIRHHYAKYGKCFRYGGDEFCVILTNHQEEVEQMNEKFLEKISEKRKETPKLPTVSIGYAYYNPDNQNFQDVIEEADKMMYAFKTAKKDLLKSGGKV